MRDAQVFNTLVELLVNALINKERRYEFIKEFQRIIWEDPDIQTEGWIITMLSDLAYDLDYYEPNPHLRKESPSFYGDERVENEIGIVLEKLRREGFLSHSIKG